jgi:hypothetical protein
MKFIDKLGLKVFSFIILILSVVLFMISINLLQESFFGIILSNLIRNISGGRITLLITSLVLLLLSVKCLFFTYSVVKVNDNDDSKYENDKIESDIGIFLENEDGKVLITRKTIRSLINVVIDNIEEIVDSKVSIDLNAENEVSVKIAIDVVKGVIIKEVTFKLQSEVKRVVKEATDISIKTVDIDVNEYVEVVSNDVKFDEIEEE